MRPRLLVLTSTYPRWGDDHEPGFVHELARHLSADFEVTVLCPHAVGAKLEENLDGVRVRRYRYAPVAWETLINKGGIVANLKRQPWKWLLVPGFLLAQLLATRRLVRSWHPDVIHAHWLIPQGLLVAVLSWMDRTTPPFLVTSHGADLYALQGKMFNRLKRWIAKSSSCMTVVSSAMQQESERIGIKPARMEVLPMGVDLQERFVPSADQLRSSNEILFVGRLVTKKGVRYLLEALPAVVTSHPSGVLTIVGFGPEETALKNLAHTLGMDAHVHFAGPLAQAALPELYRRAAVFVGPFVQDASGNQEGLPVALMEAIGCACPVIVGKVAGLRDLLGDMADHVCVDPRDTAVLAAAINAVLDKPDQALVRAQAIRQYAVNKVDWQPIAIGYATLLRECMRHPLRQMT